MKGLFDDLRHAARLYVRTPGASLMAVAVLAVGMAAVGALVSLYVDLILRPHPGFEDSGRIVTYGLNDGPVGLELIDRIAEESTTLEAAAGTATRNFQVDRDGVLVTGEIVTRDFFAGVRPRLALGRGFEPAEHEPDGNRVVVIAYRYWQQALGGRDDVLGTTLAIRPERTFSGAGWRESGDDQWREYRIVGVMAREYTGVAPSSLERQPAFWLPVEQWLEWVEDESADLAPIPISPSSQLRLTGVGRRAPGANAAAVANELNGRYSEDFSIPNSDARMVGITIPSARFTALDGVVFDADVQRSTQRQLQLLLGASILLALVAAANVSLFLLARAPGRRRELGIRMAVGAPLKRLARQLASEAGLLVLFSALVGLGISVWLAEYLRGLEFLRRAEWLDVTLLDWRVFVIAGVFLAVLTLLVSLAPILGLKRLGIAASSRQVAARASVAQRLAGTAQIAIAGTLGGAAVAFAWYLGSLLLGYPGYETRDLHAVRYSLDSSRYYEARDGFESFFIDQSRQREAIASLPGVTGISLASAVPGMRGGFYSAYVADPNGGAEMLSFPMVTIDGDYVDLLGLTLLHGRVPTPGESDTMLVNQALARQLWNRDDVVGEVLGAGAQSRQVVGVLADLPYEHPSAETTPMGFATWTQQLLSSGIALVRTTRTSTDLRQQLEGLIDAGALELNIDAVTPLAALRSNVLAADRARGFLTIGAAGLVVLLAAFGFYGTQRYLVAAGRREYAIRASLGAGPRAVGRLVVRRGLHLSLPGLVTGGILAFIVAAWLRGDYVSREISPALVTAAVVTGLALTLLAASLPSVREAKRTHPAPLLRED